MKALMPGANQLKAVRFSRAPHNPTIKPVVPNAIVVKKKTQVTQVTPKGMDLAYKNIAKHAIEAKSKLLFVFI